MELERLKRMQPWERRRLRLGRRGAYTSRPRYTPEELVSWLRKNKVLSANQVRRLCRETAEAPTVYSAMRTLGTSWRGVMECCWGAEPPGLAASKKPTHESLIDLALHLQLFSRSAWDKARAQGMVPSRYWLEQLFGSTRNFFTVVDEHAAGYNLNRYRALVDAQGGRPPTEAQCRQAGINLKALRRIMPKRNLDGVFSVISRRG